MFSRKLLAADEKPRNMRAGMRSSREGDSASRTDVRAPHELRGCTR